MFGIGMPELLLILAVALIVIGPKKLPDLAKSLGKAMGEFKRATNDLKQSIENETGLDDVRNSLRETKQELRQSIDVSSDPFKKVNQDQTESEPPDPSSSTDSDLSAADVSASDHSGAEVKDDTTSQPKENGGS